MKLLFVGTDRDRAGCATHFIALVRAMAGAGHAVSALVDPRTAIGEALAGDGIALHHAHFRNAFDLRAHRVLVRALRRERPDWAVGNFGKEYWPLVLQGRLAGTPVALFRHRMPPMHPLSEYLLPRLARRFIAVSRYAREGFVARGMPADRVQVLYNPVDVEACRPDAGQALRMRDALQLAPDALVIGFAGRMYRTKGIFFLLEALMPLMREDPRIHALWIGDGPDRERLGEAIAATGLADRHRLCGWVSVPQDYYRAMAVLAFPTLTDEAFGRASVEAQACGVPVLASRLGGIPETVEDGQGGLLLAAGDAAAWRGAIQVLLDDPVRRARMGTAARAFAVEHFGYAAIARAFGDLLQGETGRRTVAGDYATARPGRRPPRPGPLRRAGQAAGPSAPRRDDARR